ncbi:MAG: EFR1 family ferrodoxin [Lachnospiraceae bacterium]|nr:EFR1 family ferrodoxin [Lachnospiraceae bacterium]
MTVCYFTATGNSLYVAKRIGGKLLSIPKLYKQNEIKIEDDAVGIIAPVYGGNMPRMVSAFLKKATIKAGYLFFISTYGMSYSAVKTNAVETMQNNGLKLDYVNAIKMIDNYLPGFEMQNQKDSAVKKDIEGQIDAICKDLENKKRNVSKIGLFENFIKQLVNGTMGKVIFNRNAAKKYIVNDSCIRCGICAKVCPADNIIVGDKVAFLDKCEVCYACIHNCPKNAIHLKNEKSSVRFRNEHVNLNEIIEANTL